MWSSIYQSFTPPPFPIFTPIKNGGEGMGPCSYASYGGVAKICQPEANAMDQSDRAGGRVWEGESPL